MGQLFHNSHPVLVANAFDIGVWDLHLQLCLVHFTACLDGWLHYFLGRHITFCYTTFLLSMNVAASATVQRSGLCCWYCDATT